jgi:hypothetical protein
MKSQPWETTLQTKLWGPRPELERTAWFANGSFFQDTRQTGEWFTRFTRQVKKRLAQTIEKFNGFVLLLAKPELYSHFASW